METLKKIFYHPNFNVAAGLFGICGVLFGVFTYFESIKVPNLTYYISPTRTPIVQKGNLNNFSVTFLGTPINGDLSSAEIQIWNQGKEPIRNEDILKTITLRTPNSEPIYKTTVTTSRDVIGFNWLDLSNNESGISKFDWKILEKNDGIKLQIIYGGNVNLPLILDGVIVGQKNLTKYGQENNSNLWSLFYKLFLVVIAMLFIQFRFVLPFERKIKSPFLKSFFSTLMPILAAAIFYFIVYISKPPKPPFGF